jgi:phage gp29-like protein
MEKLAFSGFRRGKDGAGMSLVNGEPMELMAGIPLAAGTATASQPVQTAAAPASPNLPATLQRIIRPEAQPRWLLPSIAMITPEYLEGILRGALVGNHVFQWQLFDLMEDTWPRLVKNLNEVKRSAISELTQKWRVQPWAKRGEKPSPESEEKAALVEEALFEMIGDAAADENGFEATIYDLLDAWGKGTSVVEIDWEVRELPKFGGQVVAPRATYWVHPRNYAWGSDGRLGLVLPSQGYAGRTDQQMPNPYAANASGEYVELPADKFLVAVCKARTGNPLGAPLLRPLAWWWCASNFSADWLLNFAQVFGLPIRWAQYVQGSPQQTIDAINTMLENMGSNAWGSFPAGTTIELHEAGKGAEQLPQAAVLDRADKQCDLLVLGQTLTTQVSREGGSRALGEVHEHVKDDIVHSAASFGARVLNTQMVPALMRLNYGEETERPSLVPNEEDPETAKANAEVLQVATEIGVPVPVSFALEKLNIPAAEDGEDLLQPPMPTMPLQKGGPGQEQEQEPDGAAAKAKSAATDKLVNNVLESLTGVEQRWLSGVKPFFRELVAKAQDKSLSDRDFVRALEKARGQLPELFAKMDGAALAKAFYESMSAALVNGAVRGYMQRQAKVFSRKHKGVAR